MIETYKILSEKYDPEVINLRDDSNTRGHICKIYKSRARLNVRRFLFCMGIVDQWNSLPSNVVEAKTVNSFERRLDKL